jgi:hypothetical protein
VITPTASALTCRHAPSGNSIGFSLICRMIAARVTPKNGG